MTNEPTNDKAVIDDVKGIISSGMADAYFFTDLEIVNSCVHFLIWTDGDDPGIGILLCAETDEDIARYSVLHDNDRLFMSKYLTYLPTKEQLKREIERQKEIFYTRRQAV